jgi:hypothetical protein
MKVQIVKKEEGKWEIEIDEQQFLDFLTNVYEKLSHMDREELEKVKDETLNKLMDKFFLGGGKEQ